jgi:hypothetical protein
VIFRVVGADVCKYNYFQAQDERIVAENDSYYCGNSTYETLGVIPTLILKSDEDKSDEDHESGVMNIGNSPLPNQNVLIYYDLTIP